MHEVVSSGLISHFQARWLLGVDGLSGAAQQGGRGVVRGLAEHARAARWRSYLLAAGVAAVAAAALALVELGGGSGGEGGTQSWWSQLAPYGIDRYPAPDAVEVAGLPL